MNNPLDNLWMPWMDQELWRQDLLGGPSGFNRFEEVDDASGTRSADSSDASYDGLYVNDPRKRADYSRESMSFDKATSELSEALHYAVKYSQGMLDQFEREVIRTSLSAWVPPKLIATLWTMKVEWNGVHAAEADKDANTQPAKDVITYRGVVKRVIGALENIRAAGPPSVDIIEQAGSVLSPQVCRNTMKKLHVTLQGIEELMQSVRKDKNLMQPLVKEFGAAQSLLSDVDVLWAPKKQSSASRSRAKWEDDDFAWPDHRGE